MKKLIPDNKDLHILLPCSSGEQVCPLRTCKLQQSSKSVLAHEARPLFSPQTTVLSQLEPISSVENREE